MTPAKLRRMTLLDVSGPFRPGTGGLPPYLAGRADEQALFRSRLAQLDRGEPTPSEIILYGPRGNGKTAFLAWIEEVAAPSYSVDVVPLTPSEFETGRRLAECLLPDDWWDEGVPDTIAVRDLTWRPGADTPAPRIRSVLEVRSAKKPLLLQLDEAHTLDPRVGEELLNAAQKVGREAPFLLVLAGTPDLRDHLGTMGVSFWNRGRKLPINRLDETAAADAIRLPLEAEQVPISDDALGHIVRESEGYPYFLQLWGAAVWNRDATDPSDHPQRITAADTAACQSLFDSERNDYYLDRYNELERAGLLEVARSVAELFTERQQVARDEIQAAVRRVRGFDDGGKAFAARTTLGHFGFLWQSAGTPHWEPGIPSLMDYIREFAPSA